MGSHSVRMKHTASRKFLKPLPGPPGPVFGPQTAAKTQNPNNPDLFEKMGPRPPWLPRGRRHGRSPYYFEGVCLTTIILTPGACGGRVRTAAHGVNSGGSAGSAAPAGVFQIVQIHFVFTANMTRVTLRCNVIFYLFIPLSSKTPSF